MYIAILYKGKPTIRDCKLRTITIGFKTVIEAVNEANKLNKGK
jgi:hypothetical protein